MVYAGMRAEISYKDGSNLSEEDYHLMAANLLKNKLESPQDINITAALSENNTFVSGTSTYFLQFFIFLSEYCKVRYINHK